MNAAQAVAAAKGGTVITHDARGLIMYNEANGTMLRHVISDDPTGDPWFEDVEESWRPQLLAQDGWEVPYEPGWFEWAWLRVRMWISDWRDR
jgi:hypothetical protein